MKAVLRGNGFKMIRSNNNDFQFKKQNVNSMKMVMKLSYKVAEKVDSLILRFVLEGYSVFVINWESINCDAHYKRKDEWIKVRVVLEMVVEEEKKI